MTKGKGGQGTIKCPDCEANLYVRDLVCRAETAADESGVYVIFPQRCPHCGCEIKDGRLRPVEGYPARMSQRIHCVICNKDLTWEDYKKGECPFCKKSE